MKKLWVILLFLWGWAAMAADTMPPSPPKYFNDDAHVVPAAQAAQMNEQLAAFERATGNQIVVAVYPKMDSDSDIADYSTRVFRSWKVGQKDKNNGAVLFVFIQDRKMFLSTGYGLEGALPDWLCKRIVDSDIKPHFKQGDYAGGLQAGVNAILEAAKGEYKGTGQTVKEIARHGVRPENQPATILIFGACFIVLMFLMLFASRRNGRVYGRSGWVTTPMFWGGGSSWGGGGGFSGGGGGGGGFSGFSGGGGSSGGGGAGGSW